MALVKCPDCGQEVSDQAPACIHCGRPVAQPDTQKAVKKQSVLGEMTKSVSIVVAIALVALVAIGAKDKGFDLNSLFALFGHYDTSDVEKQALALIRKEFYTKPEYVGSIPKMLTLVKQPDNSFSGILDVESSKDKAPLKYMVRVTLDKDHMLVNWLPVY